MIEIINHYFHTNPTHLLTLIFFLIPKSTILRTNVKINNEVDLYFMILIT